MSRPKDLGAPFNAWATGNYGVGGNAWNSTSKRVTPAGTELTPATLVAAQVENALHGSALDTAQGALTVAGQLPALNWTLKGTTTNNIKRGFFNAKEQAWFAVGDGGNDFIESSYDFGRTWSTVASGGALACLDVAANTAGDWCVITAARNVYKYARTAYGTYTFTNNATRLTAAPSGASLDYDATSNKFIVVYRVGATGFKVDAATDPATATWTAGTLPAAWTGYTGANNPEITAIPGRAIAAYVDAATPRLNIMYSTDGGSTWTNVQVTLAMSAADASANTTLSKIAYNSARDEWTIAVSTTTTTRRTELYRSTNGGVSWSLIQTLSVDFVAQDIAALGDLLAMTNDDARVAYSIDRGVTWKLSTRLVGSAARRYLRAGGGGFMSWNASVDKSTFSTVRIGDSGVAL